MLFHLFIVEPDDAPGCLVPNAAVVAASVCEPAAPSSHQQRRTTTMAAAAIIAVRDAGRAAQLVRKAPSAPFDRAHCQ
jgi:hypothetical protein